MNRRNFLSLGLGALAVSMAPSTLSAINFRDTKPKAWTATKVDEAINEIFGSSKLSEGKIKLKAPDIAENGAVIPVTVSTKLNAKTVVVTRGSKGAIVLGNNNNFIKCPAFAKNTVDKVGAGDALLTIFSLCRFVGMNDDLAIFISSISAANQTRILNNEIFLNRDELLKTIMHILK